MRLLNNGSRVETTSNGSGGIIAVSIDNECQGTAKPIVTPWLDAA